MICDKRTECVVEGLPTYSHPSAYRELVDSIHYQVVEKSLNGITIGTIGYFTDLETAQLVSRLLTEREYKKFEALTNE